MTRWLHGVLCSLLVLAGVAHAHESLPASLLLDQEAHGDWTVRWRLPQMQGAAPQVSPQFPATCSVQGTPQTDELPGARLQRWRMHCAAPLGTGSRIAFEGLSATSIDVVVRLGFADGTQESHIARPRAPVVELGQTPAQSLHVSSYFGLGVSHILGGIDHLLFVLCLMLLIPTLGGLLKTITAFTLAHSFTLVASALGWVQVPQAPVEATIALSILFLARELAQTHAQDRLVVRRPWAVAFVFGLLHGFGFAGALSEVGLPQGDIPLALLLFNLGVEAGQVAFVLVAVPLVLLWRRGAGKWMLGWDWVRMTPVYAVGGLAGSWFLQRMLPIVGWQWI